jgi:hypothetical protein
VWEVRLSAGGTHPTPGDVVVERLQALADAGNFESACYCVAGVPVAHIRPEARNG